MNELDELIKMEKAELITEQLSRTVLVWGIPKKASQKLIDLALSSTRYYLHSIPYFVY
jgi:hypothetical protein